MIDRIILAAAGTGGHIFPALAVYEEIISRYPYSRIIFMGRKRDLKKGWFPENVNFIPLPIKGVIGMGWKTGISLIFVLLSFIKCLFVFVKFRPRFVLGFGSYGSFVPVMLATLLGIPSAIHEQNVYPGVANRILAKRVNEVFLSFEPLKTEKNVFVNYTVSGNPIRKEILKVKQKKSFSKNLLVFGGSQGSRAINKAIVKVLPELFSLRVNIIHQTGEEDYEWVKRAYENVKADGYKVVSFIKDMASAYNWADIIISRAGAMTLSEIAVVGRPSILIPFPYATMDHQLKNAKYFQKKGAAFVIEERNLLKVNLPRLLKNMFDSPNKLRNMACRANSLAKTDAARIIVDRIEEMVKKNI